MSLFAVVTVMCSKQIWHSVLSNKLAVAELDWQHVCVWWKMENSKLGL